MAALLEWHQIHIQYEKIPLMQYSRVFLQEPDLSWTMISEKYKSCSLRLCAFVLILLITTNRSSFVVCSLLVRSSFTGSSISSSQTELSPSESSSFSLEGFRRVCPNNQQHRQVKMLCKQSLIFNITGALQPVATCSQLPHLRPVPWATKPAIIIITSFWLWRYSRGSRRRARNLRLSQLFSLWRHWRLSWPRPALRTYVRPPYRV